MTKCYTTRQGLIKRERACNSHSGSIDSEIKSATKNNNTKTWTFSLLGKCTESSKIFPKLSVAKNSNTYYFTVERVACPLCLQALVHVDNTQYAHRIQKLRSKNFVARGKRLLPENCLQSRLFIVFFNMV